MSRKRIYAAVLVTGIAALFVWLGPLAGREIPDVIQRFSQMQVGDRLQFEVKSGHCFGGCSAEGWIAREADGWQQSISFLAQMSNGHVASDFEQQLGRDINFLGALSACIYRLGPPNRERAGGWIESYETIRLDWNDDGVWDQEWAHSNRVSSLALTLLHGTTFEGR